MLQYNNTPILSYKEMEINQIIRFPSLYKDYIYGYFTEDEHEFMISKNPSLIKFIKPITQRLINTTIRSNPQSLLMFENTKENILLALQSYDLLNIDINIKPRWMLKINFDQYNKNDTDAIWDQIFFLLKKFSIIEEIVDGDINHAINETQFKNRLLAYEKYKNNYYSSHLEILKRDINHIKNINKKNQTNEMINYVLSHKDSKKYLKYLKSTSEVDRRLLNLDDISLIPVENQNIENVTQSILDNPTNIKNVNFDFIDKHMLLHVFNKTNIDIIPYMKEEYYDDDICKELVKRDKNNIFKIPTQYINCEIINIIKNNTKGPKKTRLQFLTTHNYIDDEARQQIIMSLI